MSYPLPSLTYAQLSPDSTLLGSLTSSSSSGSTDPGVAGLDQLGQSYAAEVSFLQQQIDAQAGIYDPTGSLAPSTLTSPYAGLDPATQLDQSLAGLLGGGGSSPSLAGLMTQTAGAGVSADQQLLLDAMPASPATSDFLPSPTFSLYA